MAEAQDSETSQAIASEDPTSELSLLDTACYTAPSDELAGKSDCVSSPPIQVARNNDTPDALLERVASLTLAADVASPATMNEAFDCAADLAANAAATRVDVHVESPGAGVVARAPGPLACRRSRGV